MRPSAAPVINNKAGSSAPLGGPNEKSMITVTAEDFECPEGPRSRVARRNERGIKRNVKAGGAIRSD